MRPENIAPNYNLFTGRPTHPVSHLDDVCTGWAWREALEFHCGDQTDILPLGLVCFYDNTYSDVLGTLACAPFISVSEFFNTKCRMFIDFQVVFGYIPNISAGSGKSSTKKSRNKLQDEHICLCLFMKQFINLHNADFM